MNKNALIGAAVAVVVVAAAGIGYKLKSHKDLVSKIDRKTTLVVALNEAPETLNPVLAQSEAAQTVGQLVFDGLTNLSGERIDDFKMGAASELMQDGKDLNVYEVVLDGKKTWSDEPNHKLTSADVLFTYQAITNPANESPLAGRIGRLIEKIEVIDDGSFKIVFREAVAPARVGWVLPFKIIPASYYGKPMGQDLKNDPVAQEFNRKPIGTGRFSVEKWEGNEIQLKSRVAEPINFDQADAGTLENAKGIQKVVFTLVADREKQAKMLMEGSLDLILTSDPDLHEKLSQAGLKNADYVPHYFYALAMNNKQAPFTDAKVRRAMASAIDKASVAGVVWPDQPVKYVNHGPFPHNAERQYVDFADLVPYNPALAKKDLAGISAELTLIYPEEASNAMERFSGKIVQDLSAAGLKVQAKGIGRAFDTQLSNGTYELALVKHAGFSQGYNISPLFRSGSAQNISGYSNGELDKVLTAWENSAFWEQKLPLSKQVHQTLSLEAPYVFLFTLPTRAYYSARLSDVSLVDPAALLGTITDWQVGK